MKIDDNYAEEQVRQDKTISVLQNEAERCPSITGGISQRKVMKLNARRFGESIGLRRVSV